MQSYRLGIGIVFVIGVLILGVAFATGESPEKRSYPGDKEVITSPEDYVGSKVEIEGIVIKQNPTVIQLSTGIQSREITLHGLQADPELKTKVRVFGTLTSSETVQVKNTIIVPQHRLLYTYFVSGIAVIWVWLRIVVGWQINWQQVALQQREQPYTVLEFFRRVFNR